MCGCAVCGGFGECKNLTGIIAGPTALATIPSPPQTDFRRMTWCIALHLFVFDGMSVAGGGEE